MIGNMPPKGVSFSDFIATFAMSVTVSFVFGFAKISENSDMAKSWATFCCPGTYKNNYQSCCGIKVLQGQPTVYYYNYIDTVSPHITSEIMNYMKYDAGNVGNHDVETGRVTLDRWASQCEMPVLGANIIDTATGKPHFKPYEVFERDGVKIAILGMINPAISPATPLLS